MQLVVLLVGERYDEASRGNWKRSMGEGLARVESQEYIVFSLDDKHNVGLIINIAVEIFLIQRVIPT